MSTHIVTVLGARPQFIKAAAVSRVLRRTPGVRETLVHTGQHFDRNMSEVFFEELEIPVPPHNLEVSGGPHGEQTGRMLERVERVLSAERPDWVLVYGDTNSTLAGALAAAKLHIAVAHVEAGLRSFNRRMPEELNRVLTDHLANLLFAPTPTAVSNLEREGIAGERVRLVGDVMYDAALHFGDVADQRSRVLEDLGVRSGEYVLSTIHRQENTDHPGRLRVIFEALAEIGAEVPVVLPLHPRTRKALEGAGVRIDTGGIRLVDPLGYLDMLMLERHARLIATDSGGVQKEAFFHRVPCVTLRDETEWVELVDAGWNRLVPPDEASAVAGAIRDTMERREAPEAPADLYGGGNAGSQIVAALLA